MADKLAKRGAAAPPFFPKNLPTNMQTNPKKQLQTRMATTVGQLKDWTLTIWTPTETQRNELSETTQENKPESHIPTKNRPRPYQ